MDPKFTATKTVNEMNICVIRFSNPPVNAMSPGLPGAIMAQLNEACKQGCKAILLIPGGNGVLAGADIKMHGKLWPEDEPLMSDLIAAIDRCSIPAAILLQNSALGGGLEIALACRWRLAAPQTKLGQPEVNLGIPPGAGGTQRLPRVVGLKNALDLITSGAPISENDALSIGLLDHIVDGSTRETDALNFISKEIDANRIPPPVGERNIEMSDLDAIAQARIAVARRRRGEDAPQVAIDAIEFATQLPIAEGLKKEKELYAKCVSSPQAAAMRHVFFAKRTALKGHVPKGVEPKPIKKVGIIGAGTMGTGIALAFLFSGFQVRIVERAEPALSAGLKRISDFVNKRAQTGRISVTQKTEYLANLASAIDLNVLRDADLVIEAIFEDLSVKQEVFAQLAQLTHPDTILATNTSYLDVDQIAEAAGDRKSSVIGLHFFSPANIMPLLEIVRGRESSERAIATALSLVNQLGKTGVVANVCHGFIANRSFEKYLREAEFLLQEGATPLQVDRALVEFGMPMGPFAVRDLAGLDIGWAKRKSSAHLRDPNLRYSNVGDLICEQGWYGQKTGRGFYDYPDGPKSKCEYSEIQSIIANSAAEAGIAQRLISDDEIVDRCILAVVNEGARIVEEGIALRSSDLDIAWINGYGFPKWRGGPMYWADRIGLDQILDRVRAFDGQHDYWEPAPLLEQLAASEDSFSSFNEGI